MLLLFLPAILNGINGWSIWSYFYWQMGSEQASKFTKALTAQLDWTEITYTAFLAQLSIDGEIHFWKARKDRGIGGLVVGWRLGYVFPISNGQWKMEKAKLSAGPDVQFSGVMVSLFIGGGGIVGRERELVEK